VTVASFEWDEAKAEANLDKHGVDFGTAQQAFADPRRVIRQDIKHSQGEPRYFCFGRVGAGVLTVRFAYRGERIRIIGAAYWRKGKRVYEEQNSL
jgi:hypothetical protein